MTSPGRAQFDLESAAYPGALLEVRSARWREAIGVTYRADVEIALPGADEDVLRLLGKNAALHVRREGAVRRLCGVVTAVEQPEAEHPGHTHVLARIEPALALLDLGRRSRIFQEMSVPEILEAVLGEQLGAYGREIELALDASYPTREHCVQYRESDLAFVERLMQEEGIGYGFDHEPEVERLILRDRNGAFPQAEAPVRFEPRFGAELGDAEVVHEVRRIGAPVITRVHVRDHDWTSPTAPREAVRGGEPRESYEVGLGRSLTLSQYAGERYGAHDAERQAALRLEAYGRDAVVLEAEGRVTTIGAGLRFELAGHGPDLDGEYLVVEAEHRSVALAAEDAGDPFSSTFRCIPAATPFRPVRTRPKPRIPSLQTAVVTGPAGEEIHTDSHGRVKVQLHWDREGRRDERSSCWMRVRQPWAGDGWGFVFLPRIGMEVVVQFDHGDPDRPIVHGCLYNADHRPPYALPEHKTRSTIKSDSSPGGGGFNELRFEDRAGEEQIYLHAQKDLDEVVRADHTTRVGGNQTNTVGVDQTQIVDRNQTETVHGDQTMTVDASRTVLVAKDFKETIFGGEARNVGGAVEEKITSSGETRVILGALVESFGATEGRVVLGGQREIVIGAHAQTIGVAHAEGILGSLDQIAVGNYTVESTGGTLTVAAGTTLTMLGIAAGTLSSGGTLAINCTERVEIDPFQMDVDWVKNSSAGSKNSDVTVSLDVAGLAIEVGGAKAEAYAAAIEVLSNKLTIAGIKWDEAIYTHSVGAFKFEGGIKLWFN